MSEPIVVATANRDEARDAIALGVTMARLLRAPLVLATAVPFGPPDTMLMTPGWSAGLDREAQLERARAMIAPLEELVPPDVPHSVRVVSATGPLSGLDQAVSLEHAALLVVGPSHVGPVMRSLRGDIALDASRWASCAVIVAPDTARRRRRLDQPPRRIGVAWNDSPEAADATAVAADLAERAEVGLELLHVAGRDEDHRSHALRDALAAVSRRVPASEHVLHGPVPDSLCAATDDLDLLVIGSRRHGPLKRLALGSVGAGLLHRASCPVMIVPSGARVPSAA